LRSDIVPAAQSAYQAARTGFELGKFGYLDVLDAQRTYFQAKAQYWKALSAAFQAAADLIAWPVPRPLQQSENTHDQRRH
jgi:cobalt-zinc-cadmium efflux system outer membrane protein